MEWNSVKDKLPPPINEEVLVWVDGHRSSAWSNNHAVVACLGADSKWYSFYGGYALAGIVVAWMPLPKPPENL